MTDVKDPATPAADAAAPATDTTIDAKAADGKTTDTKPADTKPADKADKSTLATAKDVKDAAKPADAAKDAKADAKAEPLDFPDDWRERLAGDNKAMLNTLKRYASPKNFADAFISLRQKLSSGELKSALAKDATDEEVAEWRKENGIPETPDKYDTSLPDGLVIGEQDKPLVNEFLKEMHKTHASPEQVKSALAAYYKIQQNLIRETEDADATFRTETEDNLRAEWGGEFKKNINMVTAVLDTLPEDVADRIALARTPDGRKLGDDPGFVKAMSQWAREMGIDSGTLMLSSGEDGLKALNTEKETIEKAMGTKNYTPAMRERHAEIVEALQRQKSRAA